MVAGQRLGVNDKHEIPKPDLIGVIAGVVASHIGQLTRFDASNLAVVEPEQFFDVRARLVVTQRVSFSRTCEEASGSLPVGVERVDGQSSLRRALDAMVASGTERVQGAIERWAALDSGAYRRLMPTSACMPPDARIVGYEHSCPPCGGVGRVICSLCKGAGSASCHFCSGSGRINCYTCHGSRQLNCTFCGGRGQWSEQVPSSNWDSRANCHVTTYRNEWKRCVYCAGSGRMPCHGCGSCGQVECGRCAASGQLACTACFTSGKVNCNHCGATGVRHVRGKLEVNVNVQESLDIESDDAKLVELVKHHIDHESLPGFGTLKVTLHDVALHKIDSVHCIDLRAGSAVLSAGDSRFRVHAFGAQHAIFDFQNIAEYLLAADLFALEARVAQTRWWRPRSGVALLDETARFVESELNLLIAEQVSSTKGAVADVYAQVEAKFKGLVGQAYVGVASATLQLALARLFVAELASSVVYGVALATLIACGMFFAGWPRPGVTAPAIWSIGGFGVGWIVLEWLTRRRVRSHFEPTIAKRIVGQISASGAVRNVRLVAAMSVTLAVCSGLYVAQRMPWVQAEEQRQLRDSALRQSLAQWLVQPIADLSLRRYPDAQWLREQAQAHNFLAEEVYAWALLLGTPAIPKDVAAAKQWIEQARAEQPAEPLVRAASAVATLNADAMPEELRIAYADLLDTANLGLVESRYWQSRVLLGAHGPTIDLRAGIHNLTLAADAGHASAALALGKRYSVGDGVKRDLVRARRYLEQARGAGLAEAVKSLRELR